MEGAPDDTLSGKQTDFQNYFHAMDIRYRKQKMKLNVAARSSTFVMQV